MIDYYIMLGVLQEIVPILPLGYSLKITSQEPPKAVIHSNQFVRFRDDCYSELPRLQLSCNGKIHLVHTYYIPEDWPYRGDGCYLRNLSYEYADPQSVDRILAVVTDLAADPQTRTSAWKPRNIGEKAREARRRGLLARARCLGHALPDDASFATLRDVIDGPPQRRDQDSQIIQAETRPVAGNPPLVEAH